MGRLRDYIFVIAILAIGWAFWLQGLGINDPDDMLSNELLFARQPLSVILFHNPWPDQSPLYFLFLHALGSAAASPAAMSVVNGALLTATLVVTYLFGRAFAGSRAVAGAAVLLGVVSPTSLWLVRSGRMYALQMLFSIVAALFALRYVERRRTADLVVFAAMCVLNIYNHFLGFLITALLFVPMAAECALEVRNRLRTGSDKAWRPLAPLALAALVVVLAAGPQIIRFVSLVHGGGTPIRAEVSLPALSPKFLDRVSWFWFVNADWGTLRRGDRVVTAIYVGSIAVLAIAGLASVRRRTGASAALWILLPLLMIGLVAARMDVRDRYFVWALPLLWIAIASGAFGAMPSKRLIGTKAEIATGFRAALALAIAAGSVWLLWHKLPERYVEWSKLMTGVAALYRPSMAVYMPPGSPMGSPQLIAVQRGLPPGLQDVRVLDGGTRDQFVQEVGTGRDFIFFVYGGYGNAELSWRGQYLQEHGYRKAVLPATGARADIFTRGRLDGFTEPGRLTQPFSADAIVAWARQRLRQAAHRPTDSPVLSNAVVARVNGDGSLLAGRLFIDQRGERGAWRLGPAEWDAVEEVRTSAGGVIRDMVLAHPADGSVLVVAFPAMKMKTALRMTYGIADSGVGRPSGADVNVFVYVNGAQTMSVVCRNTPGWKETAGDTASLQGTAADVVMLITTPNNHGRHFAFALEPSSQPAAAEAAAPIVLADGRTLKDAVDRVHVYRVQGDRRIDATSDARTYSASDMHEAEGPDGEGAVRRTWALSGTAWDAVGATRQRSGGDVREGLWAHPRNGSVLVIEAPAVRLGALLRGYFGFTDYAVAQAKGLRFTEPVHFKVSIDGRAVFEQDVPRAAGWKRFVVPLPADAGEHQLRVEISSARDAWAHFVFDLGGS